MLPYTVIKEANAPEYSGTATGVVNFLNFTFSALLGPVFAGLLMEAGGGAEGLGLEHYQAAFRPMLFGVGLAVLLAQLLQAVHDPLGSHDPGQRAHDRQRRDRRQRRERTKRAIGCFCHSGPRVVR